MTLRLSAAVRTLLGCALLLTQPAVQVAAADTFSPGDVLVSLIDGNVQWWRNGTLVQTLTPPDAGPHAGDMDFDAAGNLYVPNFGTALALAGTVHVFDNTGVWLRTFGSEYNCNPHSIVFDSTGHAYVGQANCSGDILKFDAAGSLVASYLATIETRGTPRIDLAADGCTLFYTSEGANVLRYNVCTDEQLQVFNVSPLPGQAYGLRILADGGVLVAVINNTTEFSGIVRLDASGNETTTFHAEGDARCWLAVGLDPLGTSFWGVNVCSMNIVKFDLDTGAVLTQFNTGGTTPKGVVVVPGEPDVPTPVEIDGRMTGGGSVFTDDDVRVTHGFELHCNATRLPNNLQINWHPTQQSSSRFHLEELTFARCEDDPTIEPHPPNAPFDTYHGAGTGRYNGVAGATAEWTFTDEGEPGRRDRIVALTIRDADGVVVLVVDNKHLTFGNHQAHRATWRR